MKVKILSTSDVHGYVLPTNYSRRDDHQDYGWLKAATVIQEVQQRATSDEIVITIENGDWIQGSAFASYLAQQSADQQALFTQLTRSIHYDAGVLGNHEFNYGPQLSNQVQHRTVRRTHNRMHVLEDLCFEDLGGASIAQGFT